MQIREDRASGVPGSPFATMRENMPDIKASAEDGEKSTEKVGPGHII